MQRGICCMRNKKGETYMPMKATGIVRSVDSLGRIVLPVELRRTLGIDIKDPVEIFVDGSQIVMQKYQPTCIFCDSHKGVKEYKGAKVCEDCMAAVTGKKKDA